MREGIVVYDKEGEALWGVANVDARAGDEVRFLKEQYSGIEEAFYKKYNLKEKKIEFDW